ncbi:hypothetical protein ONE63_010271 [Megalurothrips usitatus]|uniref:FHOD1 N-terminal GTPase-binding domain-containing protein n=1 Tax=Megalurothrips usitatus TaxID=439358 RepID=A0AAV7XHB8_9NEOP|nr:hypothetical protein ONE63_010271 [Megalurothrips usitatus]
MAPLGTALEAPMAPLAPLAPLGAWVTCRVQYLNDTDPFAYAASYPEPPRPPLHCFNTVQPLAEQLAAVHRLLDAPQRVSVMGGGGGDAHFFTSPEQETSIIRNAAAAAAAAVRRR